MEVFVEFVVLIRVRCRCVVNLSVSNGVASVPELLPSSLRHRLRFLHPQMLGNGDGCFSLVGMIALPIIIT